jgi:hypothetical protein
MLKFFRIKSFFSDVWLSSQIQIEFKLIHFLFLNKSDYAIFQGGPQVLCQLKGGHCVYKFKNHCLKGWEETKNNGSV